ncbi:hypothetical protein [Sorangium sp. So ce1335]|uniref:hypothetical protein n=1 Tax=Sorangium sp. So ce1335 TaxID=3133335 RepID=UPI003F62995D
MRHRTSLPLVAPLLALFVSLSGCENHGTGVAGTGGDAGGTGGTNCDSPGAGSNADGTCAGTGGAGGGTGGAGGGTGGAGGGTGGAGGGTGGAGGGTGGTGSGTGGMGGDPGGMGGGGGTGTGDTGAGGTGEGGAGPACGPRAQRVFACIHGPAVPGADDPASEDPGTDVVIVGRVTVTAVRPPGAEEPCVNDTEHAHTLGQAEPDVMLDLVDDAGRALTVGLAVPGFVQSAVAVGDTLDLDFSSDEVTGWLTRAVRLRLERDGELVVDVGHNAPVGLTFRSGERACSGEVVFCTYDERSIVVEADGSPAVSIPSGESAEVGALTVTNDHFIDYDDLSGDCNFEQPYDYLVGVAPTGL